MYTYMYVNLLRLGPYSALLHNCIGIHVHTHVPVHDCAVIFMTSAAGCLVGWCAKDMWADARLALARVIPVYLPGFYMIRFDACSLTFLVALDKYYSPVRTCNFQGPTFNLL